MDNVVEKESMIILVADDDEDDRLLTEEAFEDSRLRNPVHFVVDGVDLMDYLRRNGNHAHRNEDPLPGLILLDLNMPRKNGFDALEEIRDDAVFRTIPVIVLTTSDEDADVLRTYRLGANTYITKPVSLDGLVRVVSGLKQFWIELARLPFTASTMS